MSSKYKKLKDKTAEIFNKIPGIDTQKNQIFTLRFSPLLNIKKTIFFSFVYFLNMCMLKCHFRMTKRHILFSLSSLIKKKKFIKYYNDLLEVSFHVFTIKGTHLSEYRIK